jgi:hypothetical protein
MKFTFLFLLSILSLRAYSANNLNVSSTSCTTEVASFCYCDSDANGNNSYNVLRVDVSNGVRIATKVDEIQDRGQCLAFIATHPSCPKK